MLIVLQSLAPAFASWLVAVKRGRDGNRRALEALLFAGRPLIWVIVYESFWLADLRIRQKADLL